MPAAKGRTLLVLLLAVATAAPAAASIPSARHLDVDPATLLAAAQEPPAAPPAAAERVAFALFEEAPGDRFQLSPEARSDARFHLRPPAETRVWALDLPEPLRIRVELPPTRRSFKLYEHPGLEIPSEGTFLQQDPLGYVDAPSLYQYALNNPASFSDPLGLRCRRLFGKAETRCTDVLPKIEEGRFRRQRKELLSRARDESLPLQERNRAAMQANLQILPWLAEETGTFAYNLFLHSWAADWDELTGMEDRLAEPRLSIQRRTSLISKRSSS